VSKKYGFAAVLTASLLWLALPGHAADVAPDQTTVVPDLAARVAKFHPVQMPFDEAALSLRERRMVAKLVQACGELESIFWRQSDPQGLDWLHDLGDSQRPDDVLLRRYLTINGSHYDLVDNNAPFIGIARRPPGAQLYPPDLSREEFDRYVAAHPNEKGALYDPLTVISRRGETLATTPYHVAWRQWLEPASRALREAASFSDDKQFAKFLTLRADALLNDDYFNSDVAWLELVNPKFDVIFAPYETYLDDFLGVKASYGAAILIRNDAESRKLDVYRQYVPDIQKALPLASEDLPSLSGHATPMEVMDSPLRAGDLRHGYQAVADNLPNDPRIHEQHGSKKIFFKNYMDARVNNVILPLAQRLLRNDQAALVSGDGYLAGTIMHEMAHGLGPVFSRTASGRQKVNAAIGPTYSALEESKADIVGLYGLKWLVDKGVVPADKLNGYYASHVADIFRTVRFGVAEAHGRGEMMEFNFLAERAVIARDAASERYVINFSAMPDAIAALAKELLEQEASGDRARTEAWFARYDKLPAELSKALTVTDGVPVDIEPISALPEPMR
jgi:hypothetical protein